MTGNPSIGTLPAIQNAKGGAKRYVQSFTYVTQTSPAKTPEGQSIQPAQLMLHVTFDKTALKQLIQQSGQTIWNPDRPQTLVWIKIQKDGKTNILSNSENTKLTQAIHKLSDKRGLPFLLPEMDLQDVNTSQQILSGNKNPQFNQAALQILAKRYQTKAVLAGYLTFNGMAGQWNSKWLLVLSNEPYQWNISDGQPKNVIKKALNNIVNTIATNFAVSNEAQVQHPVLLQITNVPDLKTYVNLTEFLKNLDSVQQVTMQNMTQDTVVFKLEVADTDSALLQNIKKNKRLHFISENTSTPSQNVDKQNQQMIPAFYYQYGNSLLTQDTTHAEQLPLNLQLNDDATFENFCAGENTLALSELKTFHQQRENFIYLWGKFAVGKTHLLQACCHAYQHLNLSTIYIPLKHHEQFRPSILEGLENLDLICLDDIDAVLRQPTWEEALFHCYNKLQQKDRQLIITASKPPQYLTYQIPDLKSRLSQGLILKLEELADAQKLEALTARAKNRGLTLNNEVGLFLMRRYPRNMQSLFDALDHLDRISLAEQRRLTIPFVKNALGL